MTPERLFGVLERNHDREEDMGHGVAICPGKLDGEATTWLVDDTVRTVTDIISISPR